MLECTGILPGVTEGGPHITVDLPQASNTSDISLVAWRCKAADVLLVTSAFVLLPPVVLVLLGYGPPIAWSVKILALVAYLIVVLGALARQVDYRIRVWVMLAVSYLLALLGNAAFPQGPFLRSLPIALAIFVLVLLGVRTARIATLISAAVLLFAPLLSTMPNLVRLLVNQAEYVRIPVNILITQGVSMTALLIGLMMLLERFHSMLLFTLTAQHQAANELQQETAERAVDLRELKHEIEERRRLERELTRIGDEERRRFGQDLHDGVCQQLTGALLRCQALERRLAHGDILPEEELRALSGLLKETIDEARAVAQGLQPLEPEPDALVQALRVLTMRTQSTTALSCRFVARGTTAVVDPNLAQHLYRIAQEAVHNATRHAKADHINVSLHGDEDALILTVEDDGKGIDHIPPSGGIGMRTMTFRAQVLGGTLTITPATHGGVLVVCRIPWHTVSHPPVAIEREMYHASRPSP